MRLVFAGTPAVAVPSLKALAASAHEIDLVVTRTDAPLGRRRVLTPSPVAAAAAELGLETLRTARLDDEATAAIAERRPDLGVIVAYGGLVREPLLSAPRLGWINLHFSLLPRWRGAAPVQHALIAGDEQVGVSVFHLVPELDAGDVIAEHAIPVPADVTAGELLTTLADVGTGVLLDAVDALASGTAIARPQEGEVTHAPKLSIDDGRVRWEAPSAAVLGRIRGTTPEPGAHTDVAGMRLKILSARRAPHPAPRLPPGVLSLHEGRLLAGTADAPIVLDRVQPAGRSAMNAADWWRGMRVTSAVAGS